MRTWSTVSSICYCIIYVCVYYGTGMKRTCLMARFRLSTKVVESGATNTSIAVWRWCSMRTSRTGRSSHSLWWGHGSHGVNKMLSIHARHNEHC